MKDYKHLTHQEKPITLLDLIGSACFLILMFLPFSRAAWVAAFG
ncbi:MAG: hypothetical protein ACSHWN_04560 [Methylophilaceae bacterium]